MTLMPGMRMWIARTNARKSIPTMNAIHHGQMAVPRKLPLRATCRMLCSSTRVPRATFEAVSIAVIMRY